MGAAKVGPLSSYTFPSKKWGAEMKIVKYLFSSVCLGSLAFIVLVFFTSRHEKSAQTPLIQPVEAAAHSMPSPEPRISADQVPVELIYQPSETDTDRVPMVAHALSVAPGALICSNPNTLNMVFHLYAVAWEEQTQDKLTRSASRQVGGEARQSPDPRAYGCELLAPGTHALVKNMQWNPNVVATLPDGTQIEGVTLGGMLGNINPPPTPGQLASN
jgi:hypothetical protein